MDALSPWDADVLVITSFKTRGDGGVGEEDRGRRKKGGEGEDQGPKVWERGCECCLVDKTKFLWKIRG